MRKRRSERPRGSSAQGDGRSIADGIGRPSPDDAWRRPRGQLETSLAEPRGEQGRRGTRPRDVERTRPRSVGPDHRPGRCDPRVRPAGRGENGRDAEVLIQDRPTHSRRSPKESEVLLLSLHGLSTGDVAPALEACFGSSVGLSSAITRRRRSDRTRPGVLGRDLRDVDSVESSADRVQLRPPSALTAIVGGQDPPPCPTSPAIWWHGSTTAAGPAAQR